MLNHYPVYFEKLQMMFTSSLKGIPVSGGDELSTPKSATFSAVKELMLYSAYIPVTSS